MAITWTAATVTITSGTYTLDELYSDAGNSGETYIARTGSDPYTYTFATSCDLSISSGASLNMSNAGDTLQFDPDDNSQYPFGVSSGATFTMAAGCTLDGDKDSAYYVYARFYGTMTLTGTSGSHITIKHFDNIYTYQYDHSGNVHTWIYVDFDLMWASDSYPFYLKRTEYSLAHGSAGHSYTYIGSKSTSGHKGYGLRMIGGDFVGQTFDNITSNNTYYGFYTTNCIVKFTNCTNIETYSAGPRAYGGEHVNANCPYNHSKTKTYYPTTRMGQYHITYDTCTFTNNYNASTTYGFYNVGYGARVKFIDCDFNATRGIGVGYNGVALIHGDCDFTGVSGDEVYFINSTGVALWVWSLDLTVQVEKSGGTEPVEGACVSVRQVDNYEHHEFFTTSTGKIEDCHGDDPVFAEKEETSAGVFTQWSNSIASGNYHWITISMPGYQVWKRKVAFTADQTITATLVAEGGPTALPQ